MLVLWGVLVGAFMGAIASAVGYLKGKTLDEVDWAKAFTTVFVGLIIGGFAGYEKIPFDQAYQWVLALGLVTFLNQVGFALFRRISDWVMAHYHPPSPVPALKLDPDLEAVADETGPRPHRT
jgi:uncharacterized membrane protein AbrB (regulator of aidB expression)